MQETTVFTPASILDLLSQIEELKDLDIGLTEAMDGSLQLQVGESLYTINVSDAAELDVDSTVVDEIEDINMDTYQDLGSELDSYQDIESGILKEVAKTLLVGGVVRLASKLLRK